MSDTPASQQQPGQPDPAKPRRSRGKKILIGLGIFLLVSGAMVATSEWYTARPQFCATCHVMQPYYQSWSKDIHSTEPVDAACVECHYAPGEHHTLKAKFRGLSQLASYFTGRYGASRPKAHVADASCLTSGCHGDMKFMNTELRIGGRPGIKPFMHSKHLLHGKIATDTEQRAEQLAGRLKAAMTSEQLAALEKIAKNIRPAIERDEELSAWAAVQQLGQLERDVLAYGEILHTQVRVAQLDGLKCASCHQFEPTLGGHFSLNETTCFTCHFKNEPFNAGTGKCLTCHEPPTGDVPIHKGENPNLRLTTTGPEGPVVTMNHITIIENNVNCLSCHSDLIHGSGAVTRRDCQNCHDQERYLEDFDTPTTAVVERYHRTHAAAQRARCNDCHQMIEHKLTPLPSPTDATALLSPVRQDCQHCHPDHHIEQVELLLGRGGLLPDHAPAPNPMTGSRATCTACHTKPGEGSKGEAVITGTLESCRGCHGAEYEQLFARWQDAVAARLKEAQDMLAALEQRFAATTQAEGARPESEQLLARARQNIRLVSTANGIHNKNYAMMLLDQALLDLEAAAKALNPSTRPG